MQKLPALRKEGAAPAWQVERLSRWFSEWKLHTILDDEPGPDGSPGSPGKADLVGLVNAYEPAIESGQLRLLAPRGKVTSARPIYVAVLEQPGRGHYLCAPFGRFSEPALPGELRLLQDVPALRVLCVWNAVVLPEESLAGSWHVGALDSDALGAVTAVRAYLDRGHQLPSGLEEDTGPPVIHPIDPRRDYRESEIEWSALLAGESDNPFLVRDAGDRGYGMGDDSQFLMAAEERARYGRELHYNIVGYALSLHITDKPEAASVRVDVLNVNGDPSRRLDGGYLLGIDGGRSVPIWLGRTWCDRSVLDRGFILFDDLGQPMPTAPAE